MDDLLLFLLKIYSLNEKYIRFLPNKYIEKIFFLVLSLEKATS